MKRSSRTYRLRAGFSFRMGVMLLALTLDAIFGELPNHLHPVALHGKWLAFLERQLHHRATSPRYSFWAGLLALSMGLLPPLILAILIARLPDRRLLIEAIALKQAIAAHALDDAVSAVESALCADDLRQARHLLGWHLVSRPTDDLEVEEVAMAAIESLAENVSDSIVAPFVWYLVGGLGAAWGYRAINSADAMWGYRSERYEWFGKPAARLDDLLNIVPARLTALLIIFASGRIERGWQVWRREAGQTDSPNAGHPMAAMAGVLGVRLMKREAYTLNGGDTPCTPAHIREARRIVGRMLIIHTCCRYLGSRLWKVIA